MNDFESREGLPDTPMRDVAFNIAIIFFVLLVVYILNLLIPQNKKETEETQVKMSGNVMVTIKWEDKTDIDVDLWARSPDDNLSVGYSRPRGRTWALLKDITGTNNNPTGRNYEVMFGEGMPNGRYTVNVYLYRNRSHLSEVPVEAEVFALEGSNTVSIVKKGVVLKYVGHEITVANFTLQDGKLVDKPDDTYTPLRSAMPAGTQEGM